MQLSVSETTTQLSESSGSHGSQFGLEHSVRSNPIPFDANLLDRINQQIIVVSRRCLITTNSLSHKSEEEFQQRYELYKKTLQNYLKLVSKKLYVHLRHALEGDPRLEEFKRFEAQTAALNNRLATLLQKCNMAAAVRSRMFERVLSNIDNLVTLRQEEEKEFLYPMYRPTF